MGETNVNLGYDQDDDCIDFHFSMTLEPWKQGQQTEATLCTMDQPCFLEDGVLVSLRFTEVEMGEVLLAFATSADYKSSRKFLRDCIGDKITFIQRKSGWGENACELQLVHSGSSVMVKALGLAKVFH